MSPQTRFKTKQNKDLFFFLVLVFNLKMLDRWRMCFLNCFTILSNFCFSWREICPSQQVPLLPSTHSVLALWCWEQQQGPFSVGLHQGRVGSTCWAGPGPPEDTKVFYKPRHQWERTKEFQGSSSIFQSQTWAPGMPEDVQLLWHPECLSTHCMHGATHRILLFMQPLEFPRPFNPAWMHSDSCF